MTTIYLPCKSRTPVASVYVSSINMDGFIADKYTNLKTRNPGLDKVRLVWINISKVCCKNILSKNWGYGEAVFQKKNETENQHEKNNKIDNSFSS